MDITSLSAFVEVARAGSFSIAAERMFLTQPAVSKRVSGLEAELGTRLFDRIGRRISLTEAGQALLPQATRLLDEAAELKRVASSLSDEVAGDLVMGTSHHIGLHRLPPALRAFTQAYPQVQLDIRFMDSETACRAVATGDLELAVVTLPTTPDPVLHTERLWLDKLAFAVNRDHPLAGRRRVSLKTLAGHRAVLPGPATYTRAILEDAVRTSGVSLQVAMSTNYLETLKMLVATGLGWSLLPATMLDDEVCALKTELQLSRELGLVTHTRRTLSNAAQAMIAACRTLADGTS
jgi:DNA-binding transcriptional LysR family regulator